MTGDFFYPSNYWPTTTTTSTGTIQPLQIGWAQPAVYGQPFIELAKEQEMELPTRHIFWRVEAPNVVPQPSTKRYDSEDEAREAAAAIAKKHETFVYLLRCVAIVEPEAPPVKWSEIRKEKD